MEFGNSPFAMFVDEPDGEETASLLNQPESPAPAPQMSKTPPADSLKLSDFTPVARNSMTETSSEIEQPNKAPRNYLQPIQFYNKGNSSALSIREGQIKDTDIPTIVFQICTHHRGRHEDWVKHGVTFSLSILEFIALAQLVLASGNDVDFQYHQGKRLCVNRSPAERKYLVHFHQQLAQLSFSLPSNFVSLLKGMMTELYFRFCQRMYPSVPAACYFKLL